MSSRSSADEEQKSEPGDIVSEDLSLTPEHADEEPRNLSEPASHPAGETQLIRQWANDNGHDVNPRGRISRAIVDAYKDAQRRAT